jgi:trimeric autotransporter adhesin
MQLALAAISRSQAHSRQHVTVHSVTLACVTDLPCSLTLLVACDSSLTLQPELLLPSIQPFVSTATAAVETDIRGAAAAQHVPMYSTTAAASNRTGNSGSSGGDGATIEAAVALAAAAAAAVAGASIAGRKRSLQQRLQEEALPELQADVQQPTAHKKRATTAAATASAAASAANSAPGKSRAASSAKHSTTAAAAAAAIAVTAAKPVSVWAGTHCYSAEPLFCVAEAAADEVSAQRFSTAFVTVE